jgi:hypothetical protein
LTYKWHGKTVTEALPTPAAVRKAEREIAEFRDYQRLGRELVEVNGISVAAIERVVQFFEQSFAALGHVGVPAGVFHGRVEIEAMMRSNSSCSLTLSRIMVSSH